MSKSEEFIDIALHMYPCPRVSMLPWLFRCPLLAAFTLSTPIHCRNV